MGRPALTRRRQTSGISPRRARNRPWCVSAGSGHPRAVRRCWAPASAGPPKWPKTRPSSTAPSSSPPRARPDPRSPASLGLSKSTVAGMLWRRRVGTADGVKHKAARRAGARRHQEWPVEVAGTVDTAGHSVTWIETRCRALLLLAAWGCGSLVRAAEGGRLVLPGAPYPGPRLRARAPSPAGRRSPIG
jgi:hypothetical protein